MSSLLSAEPEGDAYCPPAPPPPELHTQAAVERAVNEFLVAEHLAPPTVWKQMLAPAVHNVSKSKAFEPVRDAFGMTMAHRPGVVTYSETSARVHAFDFASFLPSFQTRESEIQWANRMVDRHGEDILQTDGETKADYDARVAALRETAPRRYRTWLEVLDALRRMVESYLRTPGMPTVLYLGMDRIARIAVKGPARAARSRTRTAPPATPEMHNRPRVIAQWGAPCTEFQTFFEDSTLRVRMFTELVEELRRDAAMYWGCIPGPWAVYLDAHHPETRVLTIRRAGPDAPIETDVWNSAPPHFLRIVEGEDRAAAFLRVLPLDHAFGPGYAPPPDTHVLASMYTPDTDAVGIMLAMACTHKSAHPVRLLLRRTARAAAEAMLEDTAIDVDLLCCDLFERCGPAGVVGLLLAIKAGGCDITESTPQIPAHHFVSYYLTHFRSLPPPVLTGRGVATWKTAADAYRGMNPLFILELVHGVHIRHHHGKKPIPDGWHTGIEHWADNAKRIQGERTALKSKSKAKAAEPPTPRMLQIANSYLLPSPWNAVENTKRVRYAAACVFFGSADAADDLCPFECGFRDTRYPDDPAEQRAAWERHGEDAQPFVVFNIRGGV